VLDICNFMQIILHNIRSMHNVGSIFRTADAAGCEKIYLCGITPAPIDKFGRKRQPIAKVSLNAEDYIPWEYTKSTTRLIDRLKKDGYTILAVEQSKNSIPYFRFSPQSRRGQTSAKSKIALVLGNEIKGLPRSVLNRADKILEIPMRGQKESLNVAVAFGIIVFQLSQIILPPPSQK
jgi:tRNA G18 (ribose-2'-O)-methylase SpoU